MELVSRTGAAPKPLDLSAAAAEKAVFGTAAPKTDDFASVLAGFKGADVVMATAASAADTSTSAAGTSTSAASTPASASIAKVTQAGPFTFTQADQYSPALMSMDAMPGTGELTTSVQLSIANGIAPLDPDIAAAGGTINDIAVIGPTSYSVIGYQPRTSLTDPLVPIYGPAPSSYT